MRERNDVARTTRPRSRDRGRSLPDRLVNEPADASERWFNCDLEESPTGSLRLELERLRLALLLAPRPGWWTLERLDALERELDARRG